MSHGSLCLVLHAHLPFVRHPEHDEFLEEDWLYEAITETYVPILSSLVKLRDEGVRFAMAMTVTPTLAAMLADPLLRKRHRRYLANLTALAESETRGNPAHTPVGAAARHYLDRFRAVAGFLSAWNDDLLAAFRDLQNSGVLEILTCNGTHGFLPLMSGTPARRAQIRAGVGAYTRAFGRRPRGLWLAECGYEHGLDKLIAQEGLDYFLLDTVGLTHGRPPPQHDVYAPVRTPAGPAVFARDIETGRQVWSADEGYPGDPAYREFYRDLGWDAGHDYIRPYLHKDGARRSLGIKYHRVTGRVPLDAKRLWDPDAAFAKAREHAWNFVFNRKHQVRHLAERMNRAPTVVACYDAELFGHWWYEGPAFLEELLRAAARNDELETATPSRALARAGTLETIHPNPSTWGVNSTSKVWLNGSNAWLYRYQHWAEHEMTALVRRFAGQGDLALRALRQAGRELLLMQSSDWAFILNAGTTSSYAARRFKQHFTGFSALRNQLVHDVLDERDISAREAATPLFTVLDVSAWA